MKEQLFKAEPGWFKDNWQVISWPNILITGLREKYAKELAQELNNIYPPTLENLERERREGYDEGYQNGYADGEHDSPSEYDIDRAWDDGYEEGFQEGRKEELGLL